MFTDQYGEFDLAICIVCEEAAATEADEDLGPVCLECSTNLVCANARLNATPGINRCQKGSRTP